MATHPADIPSEKELELLPENGGGYWNRLVFEQSPYLLQHAANPVDWYPWGEAAFEKAKREGKPIFLSIGYATCHWCHVMARESFEDVEVAALLNRDYVAIKVDREERPDVDHLHMAACQAMTGRGGWPLTCFLTPDGQVFYATTYLPKQGSYSHPGMMELLPSVIHAWQHQQDVLCNGAQQLSHQLRALERQATSGTIARNIEHQAFELFEQSFDPLHGGFGRAPKFPSPHQHLFLLRYWHRYGQPQALAMVEKSLQMMRLGGLFDHVGFGFHRYSTDNRWLLPHFEKMLYDQAMLLKAYSEAFAATGDDFYHQTAGEITHYLTTRMQHPDGGFYSAEDADIEGEEGKFYIWHHEELSRILTLEELSWLTQCFHLSPQGNYCDEATGSQSGANILHLSRLPRQLAESAGESLPAWQQRWESIRHRLANQRMQRVPPLRDDKVLTDWNGLVIAALARSAWLREAPEDLQAARQAFDFVLRHLNDDTDQLSKRYRNGKSGLRGLLDDYAGMIGAALALHQATLEVSYLRQALRWTEVAIAKFWDPSHGGFFLTESNSELAVRAKDGYDGASPSGNALMAHHLVMLYQLTGAQRWHNYFDGLVGAFADQVNAYPAGFTMLLTALDWIQHPGPNLVLAGPAPLPELMAPLRGQFLPNAVWLGIDAEHEAELSELAPYTRQMKHNEPVLYVCQGTACELPVVGRKKIEARLRVLVKELNRVPSA
ncbi:thioredoxin domain-containing protein [Photobacterium atrarenae]|uniref:Thioredoxin domain-containing protein n=1 Tax=Photobacterium atrarenae TaxID=865757 RepID=A0ABY5GMD6_9GAMM|nr:thioredoxin domain-containing protein [Photobacterium atrarenae]UTV30255.1 thioredoxin domain-containing protein [Photobacterium atrarenae]